MRVSRRVYCPSGGAPGAKGFLGAATALVSGLAGTVDIIRSWDSSVQLHLPAGMILRQVDLAGELEALTYQLHKH
jgi:hypothetical protein